MHPSEVYARQLLPRAKSYPLWLPEPPNDLHMEYRRKGVRIGDVGIITDDGEFDFIFNICKPAEHPINRCYGVPDDFEQLTLGPMDIRESNPYQPGSDVSSIDIDTKATTGELSSQDNALIPAGASVGFEVRSTSRTGAVLVLPDGATTYNLKRRTSFQDYALKHAVNWYKFANGHLERGIRNSSLYLVTGADKASSWGVACFSDIASCRGISLKFTAIQVASGALSYSWEREQCSPVAVRSSLRSNDPILTSLQNHAVFIRGFKVAIRQSQLARRIFGKVDVRGLETSKPQELFRTNTGSSIPYAGHKPVTRHDSSQPGQQEPFETEAEHVVVEDMVSRSNPYHPSNVIIGHIFDIIPDAQVIAIHDDDWASLITSSGSLPTDVELIRKMHETFQIEVDAVDGKALLSRSKFQVGYLSSTLNSPSYQISSLGDVARNLRSTISRDSDSKDSSRMDIKFSSEHEYEYHDDDLFYDFYDSEGAHNIEVSSAIWEEGNMLSVYNYGSMADGSTPDLVCLDTSSTSPTSWDIMGLGSDASWTDRITSLDGIDGFTTSKSFTPTRRSSGVNPLFSFGSGGTRGSIEGTIPGKGSWWSLSGGGKRDSVATVGRSDAFSQNVDGAYGIRRRDWSFKRESSCMVGTISMMPGSMTRPSESKGGGLGIDLGSNTAASRSDRALGGAFCSNTGIHEQCSTERDREKEEENKGKDAVKGIPVDSQEIWVNKFVGKFRVHRRALKSLDPAKPSQQRLQFIHFQDPCSNVRGPRAGPPVTVHKHSKVVAFSIGRQHTGSRPRPSDGLQVSGLDRGSSATLGVARDSRGSFREGSTIPRSGVIMLAPRRVQEQYTSMTTTRKLDTHGCLLEDAVLDTAGYRSEEQIAREPERVKEKERDWRRMEDAKGKQEAKAESSPTSSTGSNSNESSGKELYTPSSVSTLTLYTYPLSPSKAFRKYASAGSVRVEDTSYLNLDATYAAYRDRIASGPAGRHRFRGDPHNFGDRDEEQPPTRTPHAETYTTFDYAQLEHINHLREPTGSEQPQSRFRRFLHLRSPRSLTSTPGPLSDGSFNAPWLTIATRAKQEDHERSVAMLNDSFMESGLLPSKPSNKPKFSGTSQKRKHGKQKPHHESSSGSSSGGTINVFEQVPPDSLYMLLPLWPSETDPVSEKLPGEPAKPYRKIPVDQRQYLLVYYVPDPVKSKGDAHKTKQGSEQSGGKKLCSPTSSHESAKRSDDHSILLSAFYIGAHLVGYCELLASGARIPDEGLSVTGLMSEALRTMPQPSNREENQTSFTIGVCQSRDEGVEFYPEDLMKMGLCLELTRPPRNNVIQLDETEEVEEPVVVLSPIGRAVVEIAWVGSMALTSFGPT